MSATSLQPSVLVVTGASGAGKTTLVRALAGLELSGVGCYYFDTIGVPSPEEMNARFGGGEAWQAWALEEWIARLIRNEDELKVAVLDAQVRPSAVRTAFARNAVLRGDIVLVDCHYAERNARLHGPRSQPELATADMDRFAAYMRGQADALGLQIIDTTGVESTQSLAALRAVVEMFLRESARAAPQSRLENFAAAAEQGGRDEARLSRLRC